jgi:transposase InsO family protein
MPVPEKAFQDVHVDIVGPLPNCRDFTYLLTAIDRHSRWPEAIPLKRISAEECASAFTAHWIARFGIPRNITSDRGTQFTSQIWEELAKSLGVRLHHTTAYHPQANGLVERFHRTMKASLRASLTDVDWLKQLPWVMLGLRTTMKEGLDASPAEIIYQQPLNLPGNITNHGPANPEASPPAPVSHHCVPKPFVPTDLLSARSVWIRNDRAHRSLDAPFTGPFPVIRRDKKYFVVKVFGKDQSISIDRLKAAHLENDFYVTKSGRISRPPGRFS